MTVRVKKIGTVRFDDLRGETVDDVVSSIEHILREEKTDVIVALTNGPSVLPLVWVNPVDVYDPDRGVDTQIVEDYRVVWARGDEFPPVVIDSSQSDLNALLEGGHRVAAAVEEGVKKVKAIDLAGVRVVRMAKNLETYDFKHARLGDRFGRNPMPATLSSFGRKLRKVINRPDVFEILAEGDWGAGGCWILAEALARFLGAPAKILAVIYPGGAEVDHVVVEYGDVYIDYLGAQTEDELRRNLAKERPGFGTPALEPFTQRLQKAAGASGIPCDPANVKRLLSALHEAFSS